MTPTIRQFRIEAAAERAAIMEYDGGMPRALAMRAAAQVYEVSVKEIEEFMGRPR